MDVSTNPGPVLSQRLDFDFNFTKVHDESSNVHNYLIIVLRFNASESMIPYSRNQFVDIRASCHLKPSMLNLKALMDCGIFKYRGRRGGRRRITTVDSSSITSTEPAFPSSKPFKGVNVNNLFVVPREPLQT